MLRRKFGVRELAAPLKVFPCPAFNRRGKLRNGTAAASYRTPNITYSRFDCLVRFQPVLERSIHARLPPVAGSAKAMNNFR